MLKKLSILMVLFVSLLSPLYAAEYKIDASHTFIEFRTKHLGMSWLYGRFNTFSGSFTYDADDLAASSISLDIDPASVDTNWAERDKHLRSSDFLDVEKYPTASFKSTGFIPNDEGGTLSGDLTLHGVTKSIDIDVVKMGEGDDPWGGYRAGFSGTMLLKRADFGIAYNLGPAAEVLEMHLGIEGIRQ